MARVGTTRKTHKQNLHGIVPGFSGDFVYVLLFPQYGMTPPQKSIHILLPPTQSRDNPPPQLFMFMCFACPERLHIGTMEESTKRCLVILQVPYDPLHEEQTYIKDCHWHCWKVCYYTNMSAMVLAECGENCLDQSPESDLNIGGANLPSYLARFDDASQQEII